MHNDIIVANQDSVLAPFEYVSPETFRFIGSFDSKKVLRLAHQFGFPLLSQIEPRLTTIFNKKQMQEIKKEVEFLLVHTHEDKDLELILHALELASLNPESYIKIE